MNVLNKIKTKPKIQPQKQNSKQEQTNLKLQGKAHNKQKAIQQKLPNPQKQRAVNGIQKSSEVSQTKLNYTLDDVRKSIQEPIGSRAHKNQKVNKMNIEQETKQVSNLRRSQSNQQLKPANSLVRSKIAPKLRKESVNKQKKSQQKQESKQKKFVVYSHNTNDNFDTDTDLLSNRSSLSRIIKLERDRDYQYVNPNYQAQLQAESYREASHHARPQKNKQKGNGKEELDMNTVPKHYTYIYRVKKAYTIGKMSIFQGTLNPHPNPHPQRSVPKSKLSCKVQLIANPQSVSLIYINKKLVQVGNQQYLVGGDPNYMHVQDNNLGELQGIVGIVEKKGNGRPAGFQPTSLTHNR